MVPVLLSMLLLMLVNAYAEPMVMEQVTPNGKIKVQIEWPEVLPDEIYDIRIQFLDSSTDQLLDGVYVVYDVLVLQDGNAIESYHNLQVQNGFQYFEVLFPEDRAGLAQVIVIIKGMNDGSGLVEMEEEVTFNVEVVPEFSMMALAAMTLSITAILALNRFWTIIGV
jgi:hypothetical protein